MDRRSFLRNVLGAGSALAFTSAFDLAQSSAEAADLAHAATSGAAAFDHIVLVMMENRSFDHFMGWLPGANGRQAGVSYLDPAGDRHSTHPLAPDFTGCPLASPFKDPDHEYDGARIQYDSGKMDGFLLDPANDTFAIGYYREPDLPFYSALARNYTTLDNYFCSILGPTFPNRVFQHAAQTDRLTNSTTMSTLPTIWDKLSSAGVTGKYYYSNLPFLAIWGAKYLPISAPITQFFSDAAAGSLPAFSFVDPRYTVTDDGTGNDDHPHADIRAGDAFLAQLFQAVAASPQWSRTIFIVNFDEWGGFFDHVPPPRAIAPNGIDTDLVNGKALLGFRVPTVVASPFTRGNPSHPRVNHGVYDHTSVLKLVESRWGLSPLTARDAGSDVGNLFSALNVKSPVTAVPALPSPAAPVPVPCPLGAVQTVEDTFGSELKTVAVANGWPVY